MYERRSVQRSFRLSARTLELLDAAAADGTESRNALADRLLGEAVRVERHPLIRFSAGAAGRREPRVVGTRLAVHQVIGSLRAHGGDIDATAEYFGMAPLIVQAAVAYYAEFGDEVEADASAAAQVAAIEHERWLRAHALG